MTTPLPQSPQRPISSGTRSLRSHLASVPFTSAPITTSLHLCVHPPHSTPITSAPSPLPRHDEELESRRLALARRRKAKDDRQRAATPEWIRDVQDGLFDTPTKRYRDQVSVRIIGQVISGAVHVGYSAHDRPPGDRCPV